jgi:hypothetical protein
MAKTIWWCRVHDGNLDDCERKIAWDESCDVVELIDPADPSDILAAVRTLPGAVEAETVMDHKRFRSWYIPMDEPGRYLIVPLSEEDAYDG